MTSADAPMTTTMRAIVQDSYGSADVLHLGRVARPQIAEEEYLSRFERPVWIGGLGR